jgi:hypothetical protein
MTVGHHGGGGACQAESNHPALASASTAPPYPRSFLSTFSTYVALCARTTRVISGFLMHPGDMSHLTALSISKSTAALFMLQIPALSGLALIQRLGVPTWVVSKIQTSPG